MISIHGNSKKLNNKFTPLASPTVYLPAGMACSGLFERTSGLIPYRDESLMGLIQ
jgi:hypothetical protein